MYMQIKVHGVVVLVTIEAWRSSIYKKQKQDENNILKLLFLGSTQANYILLM